MTTIDDRPAFAGPAARGPDLLSGVAELAGNGRMGPGRVLAELTGATVVAALASLAVQWLVGRWQVPMPSFAPMALSNVLTAILVLAVFTLAVRSRFGVTGRPLSWVAISALTTSVLSFMLVGTQFYLGGIWSDQLFRTEYLTRLTDSSGVADFAYADVPGYYPRGWFWLAGRFANLVHRPGWLAYKPFAILTMAVGSVLAYVVWCQVIRPAHALLVTPAASTVAVATWAAYEPYAWVFGALIPPLAVVAWEHLVVQDRRHRWTAAVLLGAVAGLLALFYPLLAMFMGFVLVLIAGVGLVLARRAGLAVREVARRSVARLAVIGLLALPLAVAQWAPYLLAAVRHPAARAGALRYLPQTGAQFPLVHYPVDFAGILSLIGVVWCIVRLRDNAVAQGLLVVIGAGYLWYAISMAAVVVHLTLLPFKVELVMVEAIRSAGVFGLLDATRLLYRRLIPKWRATAVSTIAVLALLGIAGEIQGAPNQLSDLVATAYSSYYPTGYTPLGKRDTTQQGAWNQQLHDTIAALTRQPEHDLVVLSTYQDFLAFWPYWNFQTVTLEYANPLAEFDARRAAIESWAAVPSSAALLAAWRDSQFRPPNVLVFTRAPDGFHLQVTKNVFPRSEDNQPYEVVFPVRLFDSPAFAYQDVGPFTVVIRR